MVQLIKIEIMDTKRLSATLEEALSRQMNVELYQSHTYLSYGIWANDKGYGGISNFLFRHSQEEREHAIKFMQYILNRGGKPTVLALAEAPQDPGNMTDCFNKVFQHEVENTEKIYNLVDMAMAEKDWATWNFLQWFVKEQIEEETLAMDLIDKLKIAGGDRASDESLFTLDKVLGETPDDAELARDATSENP
jgi:ferritin